MDTGNLMVNGCMYSWPEVDKDRFIRYVALRKQLELAQENVRRIKMRMSLCANLSRRKIQASIDGPRGMCGSCTKCGTCSKADANFRGLCIEREWDGIDD